MVRAWARLLRAQRVALSKVETELKSADLPALVWYDVLLEVERSGAAGIRPFELERAMLLTQYNLSRLLERIEDAGYIERHACPDDGRGHTIHITDRGKKLRRTMWPVYGRAIESAVGAHLSQREAETLAEILGRLGG